MSETPKDGGPAFPAPVDVRTDFTLADVTSGMSLRAWLAGQAIAGVVVPPWGEQGSRWERELAVRAVAIADAVLDELERNRNRLLELNLQYEASVGSHAFTAGADASREWLRSALTGRSCPLSAP